MTRKLIYNGTLTKQEHDWILNILDKKPYVLEVTKMPPYDWMEKHLVKFKVWVDGELNPDEGHWKEIINFATVAPPNRPQFLFFANEINWQRTVEFWPDIKNKYPFGIELAHDDPWRHDEYQRPSDWVKQGQSKKMSLLEKLVDTGIGFAIAWSLQYWVLSWMGFVVTGSQAFGLTLFFTVISIIRGYFFRRIFNRLHMRGVN